MSDNPLDYFSYISPDFDSEYNMTKELFNQNGMCIERYNDLMNNPELSLTEGELRVGWYWSPSWDGLLIHKSWPEAKFDYPDETSEPT